MNELKTIHQNEIEAIRNEQDAEKIKLAETTKTVFDS
jgi:hypothetical protein